MKSFDNKLRDRNYLLYFSWNCFFKIINTRKSFKRLLVDLCWQFLSEELQKIKKFWITKFSITFFFAGYTKMYNVYTFLCNCRLKDEKSFCIF